MPDLMKEPDSDPMSPKTQRRLWRRAWLVLLAVMLLMPVALWILIDQSGKAEWQEVQARLRAKGEATTVEELNFPTRKEVPDDENFCSLPWLVGNLDGTDSPAVEELRNELKILGHSREDRVLSKVAEGAPLQGFRGDFSARARVMDLVAEEEGIKVYAVKMEQPGDDSPARIAAHINSMESKWKQAEEALTRPHAHLLPFVEERLEAVDGVMFQLSHPSFSVAQGASKALALRASVAVARGDHETALSSLKIGGRLQEAVVSDGNLISGLVALTILGAQMESVAVCLWDDSFQKNADKLQRLESILESWDVQQILAQSIRGELVYAVVGLQQIAKLPAGTLREQGLGSWSVLVPPGWCHGNAAYGADLTDRTLLDACRTGRHVNVRAAAARMAAELNSLNRMEQFQKALAVMSLGSYERIIDGFSYCEAMRRQAIIMCALYRFRIDHGGVIPVALDELVPAYLESVPVDPIDGAPMRYTLAAGSDGEERDGAACKLYSIGFDASDDGGFLALDPEDPLDTRPKPGRTGYIGDWPWPVMPREPVEVEP